MHLYVEFVANSFLRSYTLKEHLFKHTGENPHCKICGKSFANAGSLKLHIKSMHGEHRKSVKPWYLERFLEAHTKIAHQLAKTENTI